MQRILHIALVATLLFGCSPGHSGTMDADSVSEDLEALIHGQPSVVNFWAASCPFCIDELPLFEFLYQEGVNVVGVNLQEPEKIAADYWEEGGYTFPSLQDPDAELKTRFDVFTRPTTIVLNENGEEVARKNGPVEEDELRRLIDVVLHVIERDEEDGKDGEDGKYPSVLEDQEEAAVRKSPTPKLLDRWYSDGVTHSIPLEEVLSGGPGKDGIPALSDPEFVLSHQADFLDDEDLGIFVDFNGNMRFYPYTILNWHEIVNDEVGGEPIAVTYCPLCATGVVYSRIMSQGTVEFGVSGMLYKSNLLMYDRATDSLWNQVTGEAVVGPLTGERLHRMRSEILSFAEAKKRSFDLLVLSTETGYFRDYNRDPYEGYELRESTMFPTGVEDDRLHPKALIYGVTIDGIPHAVPLQLLQEQGTLESDVLFASYNQLSGEVRFQKMDGLASKELIPVPAYWFSWVGQYPDTILLNE